MQLAVDRQITQDPNDFAEPFDLLVVGGGINGTAIARDAAGRGLTVLLCEKGDLGEGTSSRSTKFIHGGLRYLENYEFGLVRKALKERDRLLHLAPHLTRPLRLVLLHSPQMRPRAVVRLGLLLYDNIGGRQRLRGTSILDLRSAPEGETVRDGFRTGFTYWDAWGDDARLVAANALGAKEKGARILVGTELASARRIGGMWQAELRSDAAGGLFKVAARALANAAGPWVKPVADRIDGVSSRRRIRLVKGSHIMLRRWWKGEHGYVVQTADRRIIFAYPYLDGHALVGTTDIPFDGRPEDASPTGPEIDYLLDVVNGHFATEFAPADVRGSFAGVRPLFDDDPDKSAPKVTRDYRLELDGPSCPAVTAFGGKLTTYRVLAEDAMDLLRCRFPSLPGPWTGVEPLPGGAPASGDFEEWAREWTEARPWLIPGLASHLVRTYGTESEALVSEAASMADFGRHFGGLLYEREARWLMRREWARSAGDILDRRTKHGTHLSDLERAEFERWMEEAGVGPGNRETRAA